MVYTRARSGRIVLLLAALFALYLSWQLLRWIPGSRRGVGNLLILPVDVAAVCTALYGSRQCAGSERLRTFWRLMALALAAETAGDATQVLYEAGLGHSPPYPSAADAFYLAFYPLLLAALLKVPAAVLTPARLLTTLLDGATIVVGGGALVWYFVLGPTAFAGTSSALAMSISMAFPVGDLFLLAALAVLLLREHHPALRTPLLLIAVAVALGVFADVLYGYGQLHGTYAPGGAIDTVYVLEFSAFALAGGLQRPVGAGSIDLAADGSGGSRSHASWLPYLSVAVGLGVLLGVEAGGPFFPDLSLVLIVIVLAVLVAVRQYAAQRELVRTQAALRAGEQAKDEFLSTVGHELRTPLTSIRGSLGLLQGGVLGALPVDAAGMVDVAVLNADRLTRLIDDILDIERMAAGRLALEPAAVEARRLVDDAIQVVQSTADAAGVTLRSEVPRGLVGADPDRIVQVLVNLLGNAVKFSPRGSAVTVLVAFGRDAVLFTVRDAGRGIPEDRLESIFERFRQVDASDAREKGGVGLGLPIARGIVEQHGGRIWAESRPGAGSALRFTLPAAADRPSLRAQPSRSERRRRLRGAVA